MKGRLKLYLDGNSNWDKAAAAEGLHWIDPYHVVHKVKEFCRKNGKRQLDSGTISIDARWLSLDKFLPAGMNARSRDRQEISSTEGKAGVPRYDGDPLRLMEYSFRVRLRQAREKQMAEDELKKQGPLGLRLIDGLRGAALHVARNLPVDKLGESGGVDYLLKSLNDTLRPRSKQEARELYQCGAQYGGVLSRQRGESIPSYVLRRKAWYRMMTDLDPDLKLPDGILTE
eukprot:s828_g21.t1